jgi:amidase
VELADYPAWQLAGMLAAREVSAREVLDGFLDRIGRSNGALNAIVTLDAEGARKAALGADQDAAAGRSAGPLHGLPIAIKDTHQTRGMRTTFGSPLFADYIPADDEPHVRRLRKAGAIIIGKTNVPEFAAGSQTFNRLFGATRNPYAPDRTAGGSSGGAAAAVASGMLPFADGSDLASSIRNPASFCNVVGLRPSQWLLPPQEPLDAFLPLAVVGPIARTCQDAALLLSAMLGELDEAHAWGAGGAPGSRAGRPPDRVRIGWSEDAGGLPVEPAVRQVLAGARRVLEDSGWQVIDAAPDLSPADEVFRVLRGVLLAASLGELHREHPGELKASLAQNIELGLGLTGAEVASAYAARAVVFARMRDQFAACDLVAMPTVQVTPFPVGQEWVTEIDGVPQQTYIDWLRSCSRITVTGHPAVSVPAGFTADGLPVGLQLAGPLGSDFRLLNLAGEIERALGASARRPVLATGPADGSAPPAGGSDARGVRADSPQMPAGQGLCATG